MPRKKVLSATDKAALTAKWAVTMTRWRIGLTPGSALLPGVLFRLHVAGTWSRSSGEPVAMLSESLTSWPYERITRCQRTPISNVVTS
jgi:hypothetical protein